MILAKDDAKDDAKEAIADKLRQSGFDAVGFAPAALQNRERLRLQEFIRLNQHGTMDWMARHLQRRCDPRRLMPSAKSTVIAAMNYAPPHNPLAFLERKSAANISVYARNEDYHDIMKKRLKACASDIARTYQCDVKVFVDTAPLAEKPLAAQSAVGWQGKHSNLVSQEFGSWLFLGAILTDLPLSPDKPVGDKCGSCRKCLDICPTDAFPAPYRLDARRCISYLTIEHKGAIPQEFRRAIGNRIYGCDDCLAVCPWNKFAKTAQESAFWARESLDNPPLADFLLLTDEEFRKLFRKSPIKRIGYERFMRNVLIAAGNSRDRKLLPLMKAYREHSSPILSEAAVWGINELNNNA